MDGAGAATVAHLAPAVDGIRLSLHVLAAAVWLGGQVTLAGLLPSARSLGEGAPRALARAFARLQWPAYAVLLATGIWNVAAVGSGQPHVWQTVLSVKIVVVLVAGLAALWHTRATNRAQIAASGAITSLASLSALVMGVFLAG